MKKLVSLALVALLLCGAVAFADPSEIQITNYSAGDVGGVYSSQIDRAISSGGELVGILPELPWQKGAQVGTFLDKMNQLLTPEDVEAEAEVDIIYGTVTNPWGVESEADRDLLIAELLEYDDFAGGYIRYKDEAGKSVIAAVDADGNIVAYNVTEKGGIVKGKDNNGADVLLVPTETDPWNFAKILFGGSDPTKPADASGVDFSKGVPANLNDGWYTDSDGKLYYVDKASTVTNTAFKVGTGAAAEIAHFTSAGVNEKWDTTKKAWVKTAGTDADPYLIGSLADLTLAKNKEGVYSDGGTTMVYAVATSYGTMKTVNVVANVADPAAVGKVIYSKGNVATKTGITYYVGSAGVNDWIAVKWDPSAPGLTTDPNTKGAWVATTTGTVTINGVQTFVAIGDVVAR